MNIFKEIINKKKKSYIIEEDKNNIAILDIYPIIYGHTLVIPKNINTGNIFEMNLTQYSKLMEFSYKVGNYLKRTIKCKKIALSVIGLEINYVHVHLVPINNIQDLNFKKKINITDKELELLLKKIKSNI